MSENKFTEHMEVEKIGTLKPGDIGWGTCDGCEKNIYKFPGVLIQGITEEAAKLLYEKVEIVPEGTKAKVAELEASNKELLEALEDCCVIAKPENPACCCPNYQHLPDGDCAEAKNGDCHIWKAIQKARWQG